MINTAAQPNDYRQDAGATGAYDWLLDEPLDVVLASVPPQVRELIELIGLAAAIRLIDAFQGQQIYIPKSEGAWRQLRDDRIRNEFTGANHRALAQRYGLTTSTIYEIVRPPENQAEMFE